MSRQSTRQDEYRNVLIEVAENAAGVILQGPWALTRLLDDMGNSFADTGLESDPEIEKLSPGRYRCRLELHYEPGFSCGAPDPEQDGLWLETIGAIRKCE